MKNLHLVTLGLFIFLQLACKPTNSNLHVEKSDSTMLSYQLEEYFNALVALDQFNGVVLVEVEGEIVLRKAYNLQNNPNESLFVTTAHQFDLRSISKLIAKYVLKKMDAKGLLSIDDKLSNYIEDFPNGDKITINHLMYHQSGLPRAFTDEDNLNLIELDSKEIVALIKKESLEFEPGSETQYSNLAYQLLYYIIGRLHGKSFAQYVQDEVYDKLGMANSGAHFYTNQNKLESFARYHIEDDSGKIINIEHHVKGSKKQAKLFSTVDDLNKLLHEFNQDPYNKELANSSGIITHSGGSDGIRSHIQSNVIQNYSFIFLANYDNIPFSDIVKTIENILEEQPFTIPKKLNRKAVELSGEQLIKYAGTYDFKDANHITFEFKYENGGLVGYQDGEFAGPLYAESDSLFFWEADASESVAFEMSENGEFKAIMDMFGTSWVGTKIK